MMKVNMTIRMKSKKIVCMTLVDTALLRRYWSQHKMIDNGMICLISCQLPYTHPWNDMAEHYGQIDGAVFMFLPVNLFTTNKRCSTNIYRN